MWNLSIKTKHPANQMSEILIAIYRANHQQANSNNESVTRDDSNHIEFISGLTSDEETYIKQNKSQLRNGSIKQASEYASSTWAQFCNLPIEFQFMIVVFICLTFTLSLYFVDSILQTLWGEDHDLKETMIIAFACSAVLAGTLVCVYLFL